MGGFFFFREGCGNPGEDQEEKEAGQNDKGNQHSPLQLHIISVEHHGEEKLHGSVGQYGEGQQPGGRSALQRMEHGKTPIK